ncbi:spermatogenesis-associated protein 22 [Diretmus argenteus]
MRRFENQPARPTAGCLPVALFNQKKRHRLPLTSTPSELDFFSHNEYVPPTSSASSNSASGTYGSYQAFGPPAPQSQWNRENNPQSKQPQQYGSNRPAPGPAPTMRAYAPLPHPYKAGNTSLQMGQPNRPGILQDSKTNVISRQNNQAPYNSWSGESKPAPQSSYSQANLPKQQYSPQTRPPPPPPPQLSRKLPAAAPQPQNNSWKFTKNPGQQNKSPCHAQIAPQTQAQTQPVFQMKPDNENSLRILTAVIDGMRHWSQFKDKVPYLFEIFATLDSAVTVGVHGAKNFLMRDRKEVVQCVFYENEQELPRLIRGQVHRCVGNYDRSRDIFTCVLVRPGLPSEQRNAQEVVKECDVEMRALVKSLHEV